MREVWVVEAEIGGNWRPIGLNSMSHEMATRHLTILENAPSMGRLRVVPYVPKEEE